MAMTLDEIMQELYKVADYSVPKIRDAYIASIQELRNELVDLVAVEAGIASNDVAAAIAATEIEKLDDLLFGIGMNNSAYVFSTQVQNAFIAGAVAAIGLLDPALQKGIAFNQLNERAVSIMQNRGAMSITDITNASRAGIKASIERVIADGINPAKASREVRQLIGLTAPQTQAVTNFRRQLETRSNLGFTAAADRRLDAIEQVIVRRHMKNDTLSSADIDAMVQRYADSLLNKRAIDIARTEAMSAVNAGQAELWEQGADLGILSDDLFRKFWITTPDDRLRPTHKAIPNMNPGGVKIRAMFITPFGPVYSPGDMNSGLINCRCVLVLGEVGQSFTF